MNATELQGAIALGLQRADFSGAAAGRLLQQVGAPMLLATLDLGLQRADCLLGELRPAGIIIFGLDEGRLQCR